MADEQTNIRDVDRRAIDRLLGAWDEMSEHYLPGRSALVDAACRWLGESFGRLHTTVVDLGSGPGTLSARLVRAITASQVVGVEIDPVLGRLWEVGTATAHGGRLSSVEADLSDERWVGPLRAVGRVDVVVAAQMLHYFPPARWSSLLGEIRSLLSEGGVLVHLDRVPPSPAEAERSTSVRARNGDPWTDWWAQARAVPALDDAFRVRDRWLAERPLASAEYHLDEAAIISMFREAGLGRVLHSQRAGDSLLTIAGVDGPAVAAAQRP